MIFICFNLNLVNSTVTFSAPFPKYLQFCSRSNLKYITNIIVEHKKQQIVLVPVKLNRCQFIPKTINYKLNQTHVKKSRKH